MIPVMGRASVIAADFVLDSLHRARGSGRYADGLTRVAEFRGLMPPLGGNSTLTGGKVGHGIGLQSLRLLYGRRVVVGSVSRVGHSVDGTRQRHVSRACRRAAMSMSVLCKSRDALLFVSASVQASRPFAHTALLQRVASALAGLSRGYGAADAQPTRS